MPYDGATGSAYGGFPYHGTINDDFGINYDGTTNDGFGIPYNGNNDVFF